ncbi:MAG: fused MFS/spermidine synthase [Elusimicrobiota bacterium]
MNPAGILSMVGHYGLAFLSGAVVLVLEILGSRLLAPFFGTTVHVWSALITVALAALAAGYAAGGWLADRKPPLKALGGALAAGGLWLLILPAIRRPALLAAGGLGVSGGALAGAALLLAVPLLCLGTVPPLCVRLRTKSLGRLGREVGAVISVSTAGGVLGALAAGFYLIPLVGAGAILLGSAALVLLLSAACFGAVYSGRARGTEAFQK